MQIWRAIYHPDTVYVKCYGRLPEVFDILAFDSFSEKYYCYITSFGVN